MTLRRQMIVWIAGPTLLIYVVILGIAAASLYRQSHEEVERAMTRLAASYSSRLDGHLREARASPKRPHAFCKRAPT